MKKVKGSELRSMGVVLFSEFKEDDFPSTPFCIKWSEPNVIKYTYEPFPTTAIEEGVDYFEGLDFFNNSQENVLISDLDTYSDFFEDDADFIVFSKDDVIILRDKLNSILSNMRD